MTAPDDRCTSCGSVATFPHEHKPDNSGLDDGPPIRTVRKKATPKRPAESAAIRAQAWKTRREKYGTRGHK